MDERIVLFGGAFDPVHNGHLIAARAVAEQRGYKRITLVPSSRGPHKGPAVASDADRLEMLNRAVQGDDLFEVSQVELQRPSPSYTFDTLQEIRESCQDDRAIELVIGADMLADVPNWYRADDVVKLAKLIIAARPPWHERMGAISALLVERFGKHLASDLAAGMCTTPLIDISSSEIRKRLGGGLSVRYMVPAAVNEYIKSQGLYIEDISSDPVDNNDVAGNG
ncbi:MAG: nicotinate (nicotinamide) nucleotide adenylyltransferase [Phycisphaerae bacterium]|jgi:nicotinate-nucleotide adenylyltransferase|nr:nicotinate (nicotinamide) nucleotide adenylyltransferase [Phycisphaerae bacterium]